MSTTTLATGGAAQGLWAPDAPRLLPGIPLPPLSPSGLLDPGLVASLECYLHAAHPRSPRTRETYGREIRIFLTDLAGEELTPDRIQLYASDLLAPEGVSVPVRARVGRASRVAGGLAPGSVRLRIAAVRSFFEWRVVRAHQLPYNPCRGVTIKMKDSDVVRARDRALSFREATELLDAPPRDRRDGSPDVVGRRDRALLAMALFCGLRRSELSALTMGNVEVRDGIRVVALFVAKTGKRAVHPLIGPVRERLSDYLDVRVEDLRAPLFARHGRKGKLAGPLAPREIDRIVRRWALAAGLTVSCERKEEHLHAGRRCRGRRPALSPHALRATLATLLAREGVPVQAIQQAMRWSSGQQALGYVAEAKELLEHPVWRLESPRQIPARG